VSAPADSQALSGRPAPGARGSFVPRLVAALEHPRLGLWLAIVAVLLALPAFAAGFQLDDYVHRYMLSSRPGAAELLHAYESPFGIANGERAVNHWQIEQGYAPWWTYPDLLVSLWRPLSEATHRLDAALFPDSAALQHTHNLLWLFALVLATTALYRGVLGRNSISGMAAVMFALDHCHGFAAGWIANRNVLVASTFGVLALHAYVQARAARSPGKLALSCALLAAALLSGEGAVAIVAYMLGFALFVEPGALRGRLLAVLPHLLIVVAWRVVYTGIGRGARFSGLYLDPAREPLVFAGAVLERLPFLGLGQLLAPPAESAVFGPAWTHFPLYLFALLICAIAIFSLRFLLRVDGRARAFALGAAVALVLGCSTHPNNRLLFFVGIGVMPLLSELWHAALQNASYLPGSGLPRRVVRGFAAVSVGFRLFVSPLLLPITAFSVALSAPIAVEVRRALAIADGRELVVLSAPEFFYVKLVPVFAAIDGRPLPEHLRALSFGAIPLQVTRRDARTLELRYHGGILASPLLELYRARSLPLPIGTRIELDGLRIEVTQLTADGRVSAARFVFAHPLEDPRYRWIRWQEDRYVPFAPPPQGATVALSPARIRLGL
jgi:hypothetical protein